MNFYPLLILCLTFTTVFAKTDTSGIKFEENLSWEQIKAQAKKDNKYIFIDCYTTWCGPCKAMDKEVYVNDSVGAYFNKHFISVKVQMDKTKNDENYVKQWYNTADALTKQYKIDIFPSFIFLSPDALIVHKESGYKPAQDLIKIGETALRPGKVYNDPFAKYDSLIADYKMGKKEYSQMLYMFEQAKKTNDLEIAKQLHKDYKMYLEKSDDKNWYTKDNIIFISSITNSHSKFFKLFYPDGKRVDEIMSHPGYAAKIVDQIIYKEILKEYGIEDKPGGVLWNGKITDSVEADWKYIYKTIKKQYNKYYAERNLITAKKNWYLQHKNFPKAARFYFLKLEKYGIDTVQMFPGSNIDLMEHLVINTYAWEIFKWLDDRELLKAAIKWMREVVKRDYAGLYTDTYANLLYKVGENEKAILWQQKALELAVKNNYKPDIEEIGERLYMMKQGKRTWKRPL
ncbi:thioredoxin fold domain-containing protein [Chitinophaga sp. S165]|uniref:thioredoxin family protein n=1 Tax=Chitinophaga sp. S165 TaxID=2135462 RepID=UPI000D70E04C|nr:thioredoxin fold domain-containing protein [Chitinophaga sp. S165]PWV55551.1 thioredoxin-like protein [Chitinophaga sp. S165]